MSLCKACQDTGSYKRNNEFLKKRTHSETQPQRHYKFHCCRLPQAWEAFTCLWTTISVLLCFGHGIMQIRCKKKDGIGIMAGVATKALKVALKWVSPVYFVEKSLCGIFSQMKCYRYFRHNQLFFLTPAVRRYLSWLQLSNSSGIVGGMARTWGNCL